MCTCSKQYPQKTEREISTLQNIIAVTNRRLCSRPLTEQVERVCRLSPKAVILREKDLTEEEYTLAAEEIMGICSRYGVPCILHTFVETAINLNCPAIHLPLPLLRRHRADGTWGSIKKTFSIIGTSVHSVEEAMEAEKLGASYITAGHIYTTDCKKGLPPRGLRFLQAVCENVTIPVYAIGGIHMEGKHVSKKQMEEIMACGAAGGWVMSGMMKV
ncbi:MAG: thiamine phosphate synthase [Lachnospiraceae bacterium]|nr:thiamine phosphate synthase [Lachnospiraceae bacterium]